MGLLELLILAVGLSMDAFAVSVCKGLKRSPAGAGECCIAGVWFGGFQALMPLLGYLLGSQFKDYITSVDHWIAFVLLLIIGSQYDSGGPGKRRGRGGLSEGRESVCVQNHADAGGSHQY